MAEIATLALMRSEPIFALPDDYAEPVSAMVFFEKIEDVRGPQIQGGATWFTMDENET
jgi:hypothetical protein